MLGVFLRFSLENIKKGKTHTIIFHLDNLSTMR